MRKIIVAEFISLDGVIQAPGPEEDTNNGPPAWIPASSTSSGQALARNARTGHHRVQLPAAIRTHQ
jgi:hypothetical protein